MKGLVRILFFLFLLASTKQIQAQALIGFDSTFVIHYPDSVRQNDTASFKIRIKNYGSTPLDSIQIMSGVLGSGFQNSIAQEFTIPSISGIMLQPNDTISTRVITTYSSNRFALGIDVVVIWPKANGAATLDSLRDTVKIYSTIKINELLAEKGFNVFPNPVNSTFQICTSSEFDKINIYDINGVFIMSKSKAQAFDLSSFIDNTYLVELVYKNGVRKRVKVVKQSENK